MPSLLQFPRKVAGYFFFDNSYEKYYPPQVWDQMYQSGYSLDIPLEQSRYAVVTHLVRQHSRDRRILDAGCGDGLLEETCRNFGLRILGIDYSHTAIRRAGERLSDTCEFICADVRGFVSHERFSVIVFNESLYYLDPCLESLHSMTALLDPNGVFIVSMYDTRITRRIWESLRYDFSVMREIRVKHGVSWTIRVLRPHRSSVVQRGSFDRSKYSVSDMHLDGKLH